jgi:hypothetical protein
MHLTDPVDHTRVAEDTLCCRGLTRINVGGDTKVSLKF